MRKYLVIALLPFFWAGSCEKNKPDLVQDAHPHFRVMFYNVENLFDAEDDPAVNDNEFLPGSEKEWSVGRYQDKLNKIARVIRDLGGDSLAVLVGLCEIENRRTLHDLLCTDGLSGIDYQVVHQESPDNRGIDVALLYRSHYFNLISSDFIGVRIPGNAEWNTRDILHACGVLGGRDTLHLFVSHWPSRSSGEVETRPYRLAVGELIRDRVDSILRIHPQANVIITGDFNDEPEDLSVVSGLKALLSTANPVAASLYDLTPAVRQGSPGGTYKYRGNWNLLDHMVVSGSLLDTTRNLYVRSSDMHVFSNRNLLENDDEYMGLRPCRTYLGPHYHGGYSDHLPVYLDVRYRR